MFQELATPLGLKAASTKLLDERKLWINRAYREMVVKHDWPNSYDGEVQTVAPESTGTVACTLADTAMTLSDHTWTATSGVERRKIKIGNVIYDLSAVASGGCTLSKPATAEIAAGTEYILFQSEYALPANVGDIVAAWVDGYAPMTVIQHPQMSRLRALEHVVGTPPQYLHRMGLDAEGDLIVRLHGYPGGIYHVHYTYEKRMTALSADADVPDVLPEDAHFLIPILAEKHVQRFQGERGDVKDAREAFHEAWAEYAVGHFPALVLELEPEMFRMDD